MANIYSGCDPIFVSRSVNRIYFCNLTQSPQKIFLETLFSELDFITVTPGFHLLCTFNNRSLKCNTLHALRGTFLHASEYQQKLTQLEFNGPCKLYVSISDLSVPSLSKLCTQIIRFSSTQQNHGTLCEEFEKVLPTQLAQNISVEYTHLRPNKLQILVPKPDFNCLCVHRYFCCQKNREQPQCCIENACTPSRDETDISKNLRGLRL
jgi:hypothetical protein